MSKGTSNGNKTFKRITNNDVWEKLERQGELLESINESLATHLKSSKEHKAQIKTDTNRLYNWIYSLAVAIIGVAVGVLTQFK